MTDLINWTIEGCSTVGQGPINLTGAINTGQTAFRDGLVAGTVWYSIVDGANREAGIGTFDGDRTITRSDVQSTLVSGVYNNSNPIPLNLSGSSTVMGTFNVEAFQLFVDQIATLDQRADADESNILALENTTPSPAEKAALDAATNPSGTNRFTTNNELQSTENTIDSHIDNPNAAHHAVSINTNTSTFNKNLNPTDTDVQRALQTLNDMNLGDDNPPLAVEVVTDTSKFSKHLSVTDTDVQTALETIDQFVFGTGEITTTHNELLSIQGGAPGDYFHVVLADVTKLAGIEDNATADQLANKVPVATINFNNNLSSADTDVQKALETLDDLVIGGGGTSIHNDLTGIQGGAIDDYFHLPQADVTKLAGIEDNATSDQVALEVPTDTTSFNNNLSATDTDVQTALETLDNMSGGGGTSIHNDLTGIQGGAVDDYFHLLGADVTKLAGVAAGAQPDQSAVGVPVDVTNFNNNLSPADTDVQKALETLDNMTGDGTTPDHNDLNGLQGGATNNHYHLLLTERDKLATVEANAKDDQNSVEVPTDITNFNNNLSSADDTVQKALDTLDNIDLSGSTGDHNLLNNLQGGATDDYYHLTFNNTAKLDTIEHYAKDDQHASAVPVQVTFFNGNLTDADDTAQKAFETLDALNVGGGTSIHNDLTGIQGGAINDYFHLLQADVTKLAGIEVGAKADQLAVEVPVDTASFNNNLSPTDTTVQKALNTLDDMSLGGGTSIHNDLTGIQGGAVNDYFHLIQADVTKLAGVAAGAQPDQLAVEVPVDASGFSNNLSPTDTDVQLALVTIDAMSLGGATPDHNDLTGLQGGAVGDYFHLLQADVTKLAGIEVNATADQLAVEVPVDTTNFNNNLSATDTDVQTALETLDDLVVGGGGSGGGIGKNYLMNGDFAIWQRGTTVTAAGYTADRWRKTHTSDSVSRARIDENLPDASRPFYAMQYNRTAFGSSELHHHIEHGVEALVGREVTLSFWVKGSKAATGTGISIRPRYDGGAGSSQSFGVWSVTTDWVLFTSTITIASDNGQPITNDANLDLSINMGGMDCNILFTGMKLEIGPVATPFQTPIYSDELRRCQRYYYASQGAEDFRQIGTGTNGDVGNITVMYPVQMRHNAPVVTHSIDFSLGTVTIGDIRANSADMYTLEYSLGADGTYGVGGTYTADAEYY